MGVLQADHIDDRIRFTSVATPLANIPTAAWTTASLLKFNGAGSGTFHALGYLLTSGVAAQAGVSLDSSDGLYVDVVGGSGTSSPLLNDVNETYIAVVVHQGGSANALFSSYGKISGAWSHITGNHALADRSAAAMMEIFTLNGGSDLYDGWMGLHAWWSGAMSQTNTEHLSDNWKTSDWWNNPHGTPVCLVEMNVAAASLVDLAGNATSISLTGGGGTLDATQTLNNWNFDGIGTVASGVTKKPSYELFPKYVLRK